MEITNKSTQYSISNTDEFVRITGTVNIDDNKIILSFRGNVNDINTGEMCSEFMYSETPTTVNKSITNCLNERKDVVHNILDETISMIKSN